jgi:hypothetical protein
MHAPRDKGRQKRLRKNSQLVAPRDDVLAAIFGRRVDVQIQSQIAVF